MAIVPGAIFTGGASPPVGYGYGTVDDIGGNGKLVIVKYEALEVIVGRGGPTDKGG